MSITPEEAFEALKIVYPDIKKIKKCGENDWTLDSYETEHVDWGSLTEWPTAPQYREPTQDDVGLAVEVRDWDAQAWLLYNLVAVLNIPHGYRFVCESPHGSQNPYICWKQARIRIEPSKPSWLPDGWRVLGEDEVIEKGDRIYIAGRPNCIGDCLGSIGRTPKDMKSFYEEFRNWTWIRRIEQPELFHHKGKRYRMAKDGEEAYVSDFSFENAMTSPRMSKKVQAVNPNKCEYRDFDGKKWRYAFVEVEE